MTSPTFTMKTAVFLLLSLSWAVLVVTLKSKVEENLDSCRGQCGKAKASPCSCEARCVIYKNCCRDFSIRCPDIQKDALDRFKGLLYSEIMCSPTRFFMVSSCPQGDPMEMIQAGVATSERPLATSRDPFFSRSSSTESSLPITRLRSKVRDSTDSKQSEHVFSQLASKVPVLDTVTGFLYKNARIMQCHDQYMPASKPVPLNVIIPVMDVLKKSTELYQLAMSTNESLYFYSFPSQFLHLVDGLSCIPESINICNASMISPNHTWSGMCQSFISYVGVRTYDSMDIYDNIYCYWCNKGVGGLESFPLNIFVPTKRSHDFSVIFEFGEKDIKIRPFETRFRNLWSWQEMVCSLPAHHDNPGDVDSCDINKCKAGYLLRQDGVCRLPLYVDLLFDHEDLPSGVTEYSAGMGAYLHCLLSSSGQYDLDVDDNMVEPVSHVFDLTTNTSLFVYRFVMYESRASIIMPTRTMFLARTVNVGVRALIERFNTTQPCSVEEIYKETSPLILRSRKIYTIQREQLLESYNVHQNEKYEADKNIPPRQVCFTWSDVKGHLTDFLSEEGVSDMQCYLVPTLTQDMDKTTEIYNSSCFQAFTKSKVARNNAKMFIVWFATSIPLTLMFTKHAELFT